MLNNLLQPGLKKVPGTIDCHYRGLLSGFLDRQFTIYS
jgi:hypothetical protein